MWLLINTNWSNGFDYPSIKTFTNEDEAVAETRRLIDEVRGDYDEDEIETDEYLHFSATENNYNGNGIDVHLVTDDEMMETITGAVDDSDERYELETLDVDGCTEREVPVLNLDGMVHTEWDEENPDGNFYQPLYIVARPYRDEEDEDSEEETIYDVYMNQIPADAFNNINLTKEERDQQESEYVESLEEIGYNVLVNIYRRVIGMSL